MKNIIAKLTIIAAAVCSVLTAEAQTTNSPASILSTLQGYLVSNDTNYDAWMSNHFTIWEAAVFSSVNGTPGESSVGNDLGLEVPLRLGTNYQFHIDSVTRFEQLFGDVGSQSLGLAYDYDLHQVQISAGLDARYLFTGHHLQAVPYVEFKKGSTLLYGTSPFVRYSFPIQGKPGAGEIDVGLSISL